MEHCDECGFDFGSVPPGTVAGALRSLPPRYAAELRAADRDGLARTRPRPATWSALEYACHVRDVFAVQHERLGLALREDGPDFAPMRRDERAIEQRYNEQEVETVLTDLAGAAERFAAALERLDEQQWQRTGFYNWPAKAERSMVWLARQTLHEGRHHLDDVVAGVAELRAAQQRRDHVRGLPTPVLADAVVRLGLEVRQAPAGIAGPPGAAVAGRALPVRHAGSVDVFLEAIGYAVPGDVMVIDNEGRRDEACIGDLVAYEVRAAGVAGIVIWGLHRDAPEIDALGLPVFSYGTVPSGPLQARALPEDPFGRARFGAVTVTRGDLVVADPNGVLFLPEDHLDRVAGVAASIRDTETEQIEALQAGTSLRDQFDFDTYLRQRERDPRHTFREHLRERDRAIEE